MKNPIFEQSFWQIRLAEAQKIGLLEHAIGQGFDFKKIDVLHQEIVQKQIKPEETILDIGCGYGRIVNWFSDKQYTGIDFVPSFIRLAQKIHPAKYFILGDMRNLSEIFKDTQFDWGLLISIKEMIRRDIGRDEWQKIENGLLRVCKKLLILEYGNSREEEIKKYEIVSHDQQVQSLSL